MRCSHGTTLVELVVALPVLALVAALALTLLLAAARSAQRAERTLASSRELRHASAVLAAELRPLAANDLMAWSDTSIEFNSTVGTGIVCNGRGPRDRIDLLPTDASDVAHTHWSAPVQPGDEAIAILASPYAPMLGDSTPARAYAATVRGVTSTRSCRGAPLQDSSVAVAAPTVTLRLVDSLPDFALSGAPLRVTRRVRYSLYVSEREWYLGRREFNGVAWDIVQPVAGPLLAPQASGFVLNVVDAAGAVLRSGAVTAAAVHVEMRSAAALRPTAADTASRKIESVAIDIALRSTRLVSRAP